MALRPLQAWHWFTSSSWWMMSFMDLILSFHYKTYLLHPEEEEIVWLLYVFFHWVYYWLKGVGLPPVQVLSPVVDPLHCYHITFCVPPPALREWSCLTFFQKPATPYKQMNRFDLSPLPFPILGSLKSCANIHFVKTDNIFCRPYRRSRIRK